MDKYESLRLDRQLCFPLYAAAREVVKRYHPLLCELDLTYTQYLVMLVLWEENGISVKALGARLYLDSGTLSPLLKSLEAKGLISRTRCCDDERVLTVSLTQAGAALKESALSVPPRAAACVDLSADEAGELYRLLYKLLALFSEEA